MRLHDALSCAFLLLPLGTTAPASAEDLTKADEEWLESVDPILLEDERETFEDLKQADREEFKAIFWTRRDPSPDDFSISPENEFRSDYEARLAEADERFKVAGMKGSRTDCGFVFLLLGEPADTKKGTAQAGALERIPENWVYRGEQFSGGETTVAFGGRCDLPRQGGNRFKEQIRQLAESFVTRPEVGYELVDGKLTPLADQLPQKDPVAVLMESPRQDFAFEAETKLMMRGPDNTNSYVAGMVRGDASKLTTRDADGEKVVDLTIAAEAVADDGSVPQSGTLKLEARVEDDGHFVASWPLTVPGGRHTLRLGAFDESTGLGSTTNPILDVPDFTGASGIGISPPVIFAEMRQGVTPDAADAMGALTLGNNQLLPPWGNLFGVDDALQVLVFIYGGETDASGAGSLTARFEIRRAGELVSRSPEQAFPVPDTVAAVGPVPLSSLGPGEYTVVAKIQDEIAGESYERTGSFTVE
jgi:GWxTD domain-containing protein